MIAQRWVPETRDPDAPAHFDVGGAILAAVALGGITYGLIEWGHSYAALAGVIGVVTAVAFLRRGAARSSPDDARWACSATARSARPTP